MSFSHQWKIIAAILLFELAPFLPQVKSSKTYYVKPSPEYSCTYNYCDTLSGYITRGEIFQNVSENITMEFLPGNHLVSKNLEITGINGLYLNGKAPNTTHLQCTAQVYFMFTEIITLEINNMTVSYCGGFKIGRFPTEFIALVILAEDIHHLFITNSYFSTNNASAVSTRRISEMVISNCSFDRNLAQSSHGAAMSVLEVSKLQISKCNFTNNHNMGALYVANSSIVTVSSSNFVNNSAYNLKCHSEDCNYGGAVTVKGHTEDTHLTTTVNFVENNLFENNIALVSGGGLFVQLLTLSIGGQTIFRNNTAQFRGGALAVREGWSVSINNSQFIDNQGGNFGGAVIISNVLLISLENGTFLGNRVVSHGSNVLASGGGAIAIIGLNNPNYNTNVLIEGFLLFKRNHADGMGGGIYAQSVIFNMSAKSCIFEENSAVARGGAITIQVAKKYGIKKCMFRTNKCWGDAGAISLHSVQKVNMFDVQFVNNFAGNYAGALYISSHRSQTNVIFKGIALFQNNIAYLSGGGLYAEHLVLEFLGKVVFRTNCAALSGGGMVLYNTTTFFRNNTLMEGNVGNQSAGGIYSTVSKMYFEGNTIEFLSGVSGIHGGGIFASNSSCNFTCETVRFENNKASRFGGGMVGIGVTLIINAKEIYFLHNTASTGGSLQVGQQLGSIWSNTVEIKNSKIMLIDNNTASYAGGAFFFQHTQVQLQGEIIGRNNQAKDRGGWLYAFESTVTILGKIRLEENSAESAAVLFGDRSTFVLQARQMVFKENRATKVGGVIHIDLSDIHLFSNSVFEGNSATEGGAIHIDGNSQLHIYKETIATFKHNQADRGAAIFVKDFVNVKTCYFADSECFFEYNEFLYENNPTNLAKNLFFYNNTASISGSILFGGLLDRCRLSGLQTVESDYVGSYGWFLISNSMQHEVASFPVRMCLCVNNYHNCTYQPPTMERIRGVETNVSAVVVDQSENVLHSTVIRAQFPEDSKGELGDNERIQTLSAKCSNLSYRFYSPNDNEKLVLYSDDGPCRELGISKLVIPVHFLPCPLGFELSISNTSCICHSPLQQYTNTCDIDTQSVQRKGKFWFSYENTSLALHPQCPFDYCKPSDIAIQVRISNIDDQCAHNRQGTLCGACKTNLSLALGSSQCLPCNTRRFVWITFLFALAGVLLVAFLLIFRLTVAIGTINGLIFYANIVAVNKAVLFPSVRNNPLVIFIAWLNLDVGIETCYYSGMDTYGRTWLQFIFPFYVWTLVGLIVVVSHYSTFAARLFGRNPVSVLATLFLLSYTKLLQTIIVVFSFTYINYPDTKETRVVWLYDANIDYLKGKHIILFTITLLFLVFLFLPYRLLLLFGQCLRRLPKKKGLHWTGSLVFNSIMDAYHAPYKIKHRYWTGLMLLVRCVLFLTFSFNALGDPNINLFAINTVILLVIVHATYLKVYSNKALTFLELSFMINLAILAGITHQIQLSQHNKDSATKISVIIVFLTFIAILAFHCYIQLKDTAIRKKIKQKRMKTVSQQELNIVISTEKSIPTTTVVERPHLEPLLKDYDI